MLVTATDISVLPTATHTQVFFCQNYPLVYLLEHKLWIIANQNRGAEAPVRYVSIFRRCDNSPNPQALAKRERQPSNKYRKVGQSRNKDQGALEVHISVLKCESRNLFVVCFFLYTHAFILA